MTSTASAASTAATVASGAIPFKPVAPQDASALGGSWLATVLLLAIAAGIALLLRRRLGLGWRRPAAERLVAVVETQRLGERMRLSVVRYRGRELLLAHGDQTATVMAEHTVERALDSERGPL